MNLCLGMVVFILGLGTLTAGVKNVIVDVVTTVDDEPSLNKWFEVQ